MYQVIYADPPWSYNGKVQHNTKNGNQSAQDHYPQLTLEQLKQLRVQSIADRNSILFLWTSSPHLPQALELMKAWGFEYKTVAFVWDKQKVNPGYYTMSQCELCLVGVKGTIPKPRGTRNERQFLSSMRQRHSAKPEQIRERIQRMFPTQRKVELFARATLDGWDVWGNEVPTQINLEPSSIEDGV
jgi:N6-adenosine-specific RNA methylase IME4